jgi:hypothetical protein
MGHELFAHLHSTRLELCEKTLVFGGAFVWCNYTFEMYIELDTIQVPRKSKHI